MTARNLARVGGRGFEIPSPAPNFFKEMRGLPKSTKVNDRLVLHPSFTAIGRFAFQDLSIPRAFTTP